VDDSNARAVPSSAHAADQLRAAEMETAALYTLAARALSILTVSDNLVTGEQTTSDERQTGFGEMAALALVSEG
jgi:purine-nucleoside phosphorylase